MTGDGKRCARIQRGSDLGLIPADERELQHRRPLPAPTKPPGLLCGGEDPPAHTYTHTHWWWWRLPSAPPHPKSVLAGARVLKDAAGHTTEGLTGVCWPQRRCAIDGGAEKWEWGGRHEVQRWGAAWDLLAGCQRGIVHHSAWLIVPHGQSNVVNFERNFSEKGWRWSLLENEISLSPASFCFGSTLLGLLMGFFLHGDFEKVLPKILFKQFLSKVVQLLLWCREKRALRDGERLGSNKGA